ncbi:MAG: hypothetical protein ATN35_00370 [Epulopiscium sp. Nele67-Bin004]|nr:MAG: hypothetical protein ATN35_00370 [Epulopiscium sp. Nele67-Bin004]
MHDYLHNTIQCPVCKNHFFHEEEYVATDYYIKEEIYTNSENVDRYVCTNCFYEQQNRSYTIEDITRYLLLTLQSQPELKSPTLTEYNLEYYINNLVYLVNREHIITQMLEQIKISEPKVSQEKQFSNNLYSNIIQEEFLVDSKLGLLSYITTQNQSNLYNTELSILLPIEDSEYMFVLPNLTKTVTAKEALELNIILSDYAQKLVHTVLTKYQDTPVETIQRIIVGELIKTQEHQPHNKHGHITHEHLSTKELDHINTCNQQQLEINCKNQILRRCMLSMRVNQDNKH